MNRLRDMDTGFGVHVYRKPDLALVLGETGQRLDRTLSSLVAANVLVRAARGVYAFAWSAHLGEATLHTVARRLRPRQLVWESLESALSRWGVISQIPVDRVTFMTTGREGLAVTPYGTIEFTHCALDWSRILPNLVPRDGGMTPLASKRWAYRDLKATGRNLDLVDMDELENDDGWELHGVRLQGGRGGHRAFGRHGCPASRGGEGTAALPDTFRHAGRRLLRPDRVPRRHEPASVPRVPRYSEDLDFAGGTGFGVDDLRGLGECVRSSLAGMSPDVQVKVREPVRDEGLVRRWRISIRTAAQRRDLPSQSIKLEVASVPAHEPQTRPVRVNYPSVSAIAGDIILAVESPTEILADKLLSFACSSHIRRRDLWDMCWLSSRADVDASRAFRMATLKAGEYGEVGEWEARAGRLREIPSVLSSDAFLDEMRRFLPARMLVATVESLSWREYASQAVTGLYDPSGPAWASPYGSPGFGRPMPEPDQSSAVPMWRDGGPALS
ncbi:nucleotidyl transferase AbiEii/AbiGii toxin family protein [Bifidobacterium longum]|nr:nucleotidyl transferase AbiEii/AbiGii toxin family protein [Bifidobacterium longum]MDF4078952.1 nucleotidyl transferase AbiEii/AbiGii toxin family protein [Bifidobacterium longum]MDF4089776.1 nucleotidyl transferase AbiEii/AbiGii toxin family protein [Bifidobacterium longum]